jgi:hypothetical protein
VQPTDHVALEWVDMVYLVTDSGLPSQSQGFSVERSDGFQVSPRRDSALLRADPLRDQGVYSVGISFRPSRIRCRSALFVLLMVTPAPFQVVIPVLCPPVAEGVRVPLVVGGSVGPSILSLRLRLQTAARLASRTDATAADVEVREMLGGMAG